MERKKRAILNALKVDFDEIVVEGDVNPSEMWTSMMHNEPYIWTQGTTLFFSDDPESSRIAHFRFDNEGAMDRYIQRQGIASKISRTMQEFDFDY